MARSIEMPEHTSQTPSIGDIRPSRADNLPVTEGRTELLSDVRPRRPDSAPGVDEPTGSLGDVAADPAAAPPPPARGRLQYAATVAATASLHMLALLALISAPPSMLGGGGHSLDAISVSIVPASALESSEVRATVAPSASSGIVSPVEGQDAATSAPSPDSRQAALPPEPEIPQPTEAAPAEQAAAPPEPAPVATPEEAPVVVDKPAPPDPAEERKVALAEPPPPPPEPPEERTEPDVRTDPPKDATEAPAPEAHQAGGMASRGVAPEQPPAPAAAAALPGEVHAYGLAVQAALLAVDVSDERKRLATSRTRGTAVIRIAIRPDGKLDRAEIATSSGRPELDEAAVRLVRLTMFPQPPAGLNDAQRIYLAPIVFK